LAYQRTGNAATVGSLIVGGAFYNPPVVQFPASYLGKYFFSDYAYNGWIRQFNPADKSTANFSTPRNGGNYLDVKVAPDGSLYYLLRAASGSLVRVTYNASSEVQSQRKSAVDFSMERGGISNPGIRFRFTVPEKSPVHLAVYDPSGRKAATLANGLLAKGLQVTNWDASTFPPGVYQVRLKIHSAVITHRLLLIP
jgi:hypothetical protein